MRALKLFLLLAVVAFATVPGDLQAQKKQRGDRNLITKDDLSEARGAMNTAYDVVRTLRSQWLNPSLMKNSSSMATTGSSGIGGTARDVVVYIDDIRQQTPDDLRTVKTDLIVEIRYLDQNRAIQTRGPGHELGAIEVTTVNKKK